MAAVGGFRDLSGKWSGGIRSPGQSGLAAGLLTLFTLAGCNRTVEVRYRITIEVLDHGSVRSGSGVWSVTVTRGLLGSYESHLRGEAVIVDLGARGRMFAVVAGRSKNGLPTSPDHVALLPEALFGDVARSRARLSPLHQDRIDDLEAIRGQVGRSVSLNCDTPSECADFFPFLVRFGDLRDPTSVRVVDPTNLAAEFGEGVSLRGISVQITDEQVTQNPADAMPQYTGRPKFSRWYSSLSQNDPRRIGPENLAQGVK